ncbi:MAG: hypothetical protein MRY64_05870 [Hyphomonadaceae bacterium]|nr:hypothetical protein [Hyphomonadaceae bacterium]
MLFTVMIVVGAILGLVIALLGHPKIGGMLLGGRRDVSDDHDVNEGF